jgi:hypothetical protein
LNTLRGATFSVRHTEMCYLDAKNEIEANVLAYYCLNV